MKFIFFYFMKNPNFQEKKSVYDVIALGIKKTKSDLNYYISKKTLKMGKDKKVKKFYDEDGQLYTIPSNYEEEEEERSDRSDEEDNNKEEEEEDDDSRDSREKKHGKKRKSKSSSSENKKSKSSTKKRSLEEEASLQGDEAKTEKEKLQQFLTVNKKKYGQAESFCRKYRKAEKALKTMQLADWQKADRALTEAAKRKSLLNILENNRTMNDNNQLRKGSTKIREHGETLFKEAKEIATTLSPEESEKLWSDAYQGRNRNAKCFDELITKKEAMSRGELDALRRSLINAGLDPSLQDKVIGDISSLHKTPSEKARDKNAALNPQTPQAIEITQLEQIDESKIMEPERIQEEITNPMIEETLPQSVEQLVN